MKHAWIHYVWTVNSTDENSAVTFYSAHLSMESAIAELRKLYFRQVRVPVENEEDRDYNINIMIEFDAEAATALKKNYEVFTPGDLDNFEDIFQINRVKVK